MAILTTSALSHHIAAASLPWRGGRRTGTRLASGRDMDALMTTILTILGALVGGAAALLVLAWLAGVRYVPHGRVGIVEKLWSSSGGLSEGRMLATRGEAGLAADVLRGGVHFGFFPWQYRVHKLPLVLVAQGKLGYVYARDGRPLAPDQTLGRVVDCNHFQDARRFLDDGGQRGRQRAVLREGLYAINTALFVVITEDAISAGPVRNGEQKVFADWRHQLAALGGFQPVVIGSANAALTPPSPSATPGVAASSLEPGDAIGVVTVHDGPAIESGEVIAAEIRPDADGLDHSCFQDPEAFVALGGRRGKQLQVLTDGTYFVNRWFATVELKPKTLIPIGYVGVVVSYFGVEGRDVTGQSFRYGEQVEQGHRGVWRQALPPGKYPLNPYALRVELVPTVNFVLRWITGSVDAHRYDENLQSIELITADGYEPVLPLSLVLHIDYEKAPRVIQRFGDVNRLISQTLDPILSSYFRDVAQAQHMLDLLTRRDEIQKTATAELGRRFQDYDINCIAVLIGRPESKRKGPAGEDPIERLFDQLRQRRLAEEQVGTFRKREEAAAKLRALKDAEAAAEKQTELTQTRIEVEVEQNRGDAALARAERLARRDVARAEGRSRSRELLGKGDAARIAQTGLAEAEVFAQKVRSFGDARLFALGTALTELARSRQPLVPERLFVLGGNGHAGAGGDGASTGGSLLGQLVALLLAERTGMGPGSDAPARAPTAATTDVPTAVPITGPITGPTTGPTEGARAAG
jgi:uncharacterized membrane protein YqiK